MRTMVYNIGRKHPPGVRKWGCHFLRNWCSSVHPRRTEALLSDTYGPLSVFRVGRRPYFLTPPVFPRGLPFLCFSLKSGRHPRRKRAHTAARELLRFVFDTSSVLAAFFNCALVLKSHGFQSKRKMIDSSLRFHIRVAKKWRFMWGCTLRVASCHRASSCDRQTKICYKIQKKRQFHQLRLSSLLQRFSSGVLRRL